MSTLFTTKLDIPDKHLQMMIVCNSNLFIYKQDFYKLKHKILEQYGHSNGYDLQIIKKKCWSCAGTGKYALSEDCYHCFGTGTYTTNYYILQRYRINDHIFHVPVQEYDAYRIYKSRCKNTIEGVIQHRPVPGNPEFCYGVLLWIYDRDGCYLFLSQYSKRLRTNAKHKWNAIMQSSNNPLKAFYNYFNITLKDHQPDTDDLPF